MLNTFFKGIGVFFTVVAITTAIVFLTTDPFAPNVYTEKNKDLPKKCLILGLDTGYVTQWVPRSTGNLNYIVKYRDKAGIWHEFYLSEKEIKFIE